MTKGIYERKGKNGDVTYYIRYQVDGTDIKERVGRKSRAPMPLRHPFPSHCHGRRESGHGEGSLRPNWNQHDVTLYSSRTGTQSASGGETQKSLQSDRRAKPIARRDRFAGTERAINAVLPSNLEQNRNKQMRRVRL